MSDAMRVLVVDDNAILRMGLVEAIRGKSDLEVISEAQNGLEAIERYRELLPDVVTMDYQMPGMDGFESTANIINEFPDAKIVLLSVHEGEEDVWNAVQAGARGYLNKSGEIIEVIEAIREVAAGGSYFPAKISEKLKNRESRADLSVRELEVLKLIVEGNSNKEVLEKLDISIDTVKLHVSNILKKLQAADRTQAALKAVKEGIVHFKS